MVSKNFHFQHFHIVELKYSLFDDAFSDFFAAQLQGLTIATQ